MLTVTLHKETNQVLRAERLEQLHLKNVPLRSDTNNKGWFFNQTDNYFGFNFLDVH